MLPITFGHAPAGVGILFQRLQAAFLEGFGQVEPELEDQGAFVGEHLLEAHIAFHGFFQIDIAALAIDPVEDGQAVPGTLEDADLAARWQDAPESPHGRAVVLLVRGFAHAVGLDVARIQPFIEQVHRLATTAAIDAADDDDHLETALSHQFVLGVEQGLAQGGQFLLVGFPVDFVADFRGFEHVFLPKGNVSRASQHASLPAARTESSAPSLSRASLSRK